LSCSRSSESFTTSHCAPESWHTTSAMQCTWLSAALCEESIPAQGTMVELHDTTAATETPKSSKSGPPQPLSQSVLFIVNELQVDFEPLPVDDQPLTDQWFQHVASTKSRGIHRGDGGSRVPLSERRHPPSPRIHGLCS
jgi:hypothetical protein